MKRKWEEVARDKQRAQWAGIYVTLNAKGSLVLSRATHKRMGGAEAVLLLYDPPNHTIGLRPTYPAIKNAYPVLRSGSRGGCRINAYRLLTERGICIEETLEFPDAHIDEDGILVLNLRTAKISNRSLNHATRRVREVEKISEA